MMDNDEVKIMRVRDKTMVTKKKGQKNTQLFDGFLQRRSFFVIPQMDKLKKSGNINDAKSVFEEMIKHKAI